MVAGNYMKCGWNTTLTETTSCHVGKRKRIDWVRDTACTKGGNVYTVQGSAKRWSPGCVNAASKARQKW